MPVSTSVHISHCLQYLIAIDPASVLDVGCGFGLWGFLGRMYLDVAKGRVQPETWQTRIDGIECFEPYIQPHQRALYSSIVIGDIRTLVDAIDEYDVIVAGDVIEHLNKDEGEIVLERLYAKARKALIVNIPLGAGWEHPEANDNPQELHRSVWEVGDLAAYPAVQQVFELPCGKYGAFVCLKDVSAPAQADGLWAAVQRHEQAGELEEAAACVSRLHELDPSDAEAAFYCADLSIRRGRTEQAVAVLKRLVEKNPAYSEGGTMLVRILRALGRHDEARQYEKPGESKQA